MGLSTEFRINISNLSEGCEYVDVPYTENLCTDYKYNYTITHEKFLNSRYGYEHVCTGVVTIEPTHGAGNWVLSYVFEIDGQTYKDDNITNYIMPGKPGRFIFEHLCEENTEFNGVYIIEEEPMMTICGPGTMYKKEIKCGLETTS